MQSLTRQEPSYARGTTPRTRNSRFRATGPHPARPAPDAARTRLRQRRPACPARRPPRLREQAPGAGRRAPRVSVRSDTSRVSSGTRPSGRVP
ncbi:hypothetical protein FPJ27_24735 [Burkholderia sp. MS455]|nr:hypothetical protein FPJ27_24735 [Burkholderia sp. MS455]